MKRAWPALLAITLLALGGIVLIVHAQTATIDLSLTTFPLNPEPGQKVTITAQSYGADITQAEMSWTDNGKVFASNIGETQVTVTAPAAGDSATIAVTASGGSFTATTTTLVLRPGSLDLLWEGADSYTPPFYKGRALPSTDGIIRVTAVPAASAPADLTYNWSQNSSALPDNSGYDKSSLLFKNNELDPPEDIDVTAENGDFTAENSVTITPGNPAVVGYLNNNGYIDYANGSNTSLTTTGTGAVVHFEPYFFSAPSSIGKNLAFTYTDNSGNSIPAGAVKNELSISPPSSGSNIQLNVAISTIVYTLQNVTAPFSINFN
jgi:hypothetical protein